MRREHGGDVVACHDARATPATAHHGGGNVLLDASVSLTWVCDWYHVVPYGTSLYILA